MVQTAHEAPDIVLGKGLKHGTVSARGQVVDGMVLGCCIVCGEGLEGGWVVGRK